MEWHDIVVVIVPTLIEMPLQPSSLGVMKQKKVASGYIAIARRRTCS